MCINVCVIENVTRAVKENGDLLSIFKMVGYSVVIMLLSNFLEVNNKLKGGYCFVYFVYFVY